MYHADYARKNRDRKMAANRRRSYGLEPGDYADLLEAQGGACAICGNDSSAASNGGRRSLSVDHDHATGEVRGLLCNNCNRAIGLLKDDRELLLRAVDYLTTKEFA